MTVFSKKVMLAGSKILSADCQYIIDSYFYPNRAYFTEWRKEELMLNEESLSLVQTTCLNSFGWGFCHFETMLISCQTI